MRNIISDELEILLGKGHRSIWELEVNQKITKLDPTWRALSNKFDCIELKRMQVLFVDEENWAIDSPMRSEWLYHRVAYELKAPK